MLRTERIARATTKENFVPLLGYEVGLLEVLSMQNLKMANLYLRNLFAACREALTCYFTISIVAFCCIVLSSCEVFIQVCVVAILSMIWYILGGLFTGNRSLDLQLWTWEMVWTSLLSFPWIPAIYTGVFSTGLCLWLEVFLSTAIHWTPPPSPCCFGIDL